jgi:energy-converting hydrogenase Eha subunit C
MDYILLFLFGWMVVCSPALIVTLIANNRRRRETSELNNTITDLSRRLESLERRSREEAPHAPQTAPSAAVAPAMRIAAEEVRVAPPPVATPPPWRESVITPKPAPVVSAPPTPATVAPPVVAQTLTPPAKPEEPVAAPRVSAPPSTPRAVVPAQPAKPVEAAPPAPSSLPPAPVQHQPVTPARVMTPSPAPTVSAAQVRASSGTAGFTGIRTAYDSERQKPKKPRASFEELIGYWAPKLGIAILTIGVGYLVAAKWGSLSEWLRVVIVYSGGLGILTAGIFAERKERYQTLGRALIGGGWAITVLATYAVGHTDSMRVVPSNALDLLLLMAVIAVMVWHTLKYNSQVVTGAGFLLGCAAIALNPDPPYNLVAIALLVAGMTIIVLRYGWFELEIFGILASYLTHFYWLYIVFSLQPVRAPFPQHTVSLLLVIAYWTIFRVSYVVRSVQSKEQESVSTIAGLLNPLLFLAVMKYQSFHPEWAFYALLGLGATEFLLGQLPVSRRRVAPFKVLSCLGAAMMVAAVPFKYSGDSLEMLWLAGGEAFLLAGIFTRERLFRGFGLMVSALVALYAFVVRVAPLFQEIVNGQAHYHLQFGIVLAVIAAVFYLNAHVFRRGWASLFAEELESQALRALSLAAGVFAVCATYALVADNAVAIVLALLVFALSLLGQRFAEDDLIYQAHWISVVAAIQAIVTGRTLEISWHGVPERVLIFAPVAGLLYLSSRSIRLSQTRGKPVFAAAYACVATSLLAILIWFQSPDWSMPLLWLGLGLALSLVGDALKRTDLKWQAFALVLISFARALTVNMNMELGTLFHGVTDRLISVALTAAGIYLLARWAPRYEVRPVYTVAGTSLLALLAFKETPEPWIPVAWIALALLLAVAARFWKDRALLWQAHALSLLAAAWTLYSSFAPAYQGSRVQLISVLITAGSLYILNWITNVAGIIGDKRISQLYSWAGSLLLSWLIWYQRPANEVSLLWALLGLALFMIGDWRSWTFLRAQSYVALTFSFAHIFYANFNVLAATDAARPDIITVVPLVGIYFFIYWQLHGKKAVASQLEAKIRVEHLLACLGTATLAALARFELPQDMVAVGYAALVVATLLAAWLTRLPVFLYQALVLLGMAAFRVSMYNFYHLHQDFGFGIASSIWTIAILSAGVPISLAMRNRGALALSGPRWAMLLAERAEQPMFFVPFALIFVLLALKIEGTIVTLAWAAQGIVLFFPALWAKQRSFWRASMGLVMACALKAMLWDWWHFSGVTARFLTLIGVGVLTLAVAFLLFRNREALREYL